MVGFAKTQSEVMSANVSLASLAPTVKLTSMNVNLVSAQQIWNVLMVLEHINVSAEQVTQVCCCCLITFTSVSQATTVFS
jgi:hypothetical protein